MDIEDLKGKDPLWLNMGSGNHRLKNKDYINIDSFAADNVDIVSDVRELVLPNNTVDHIYSSHFLQYLTKEDAMCTLINWYNMIKPGGKIIISVPDFWVLSDIYQKRNSIIEVVGPIMGILPNGLSHKMIYDTRLLNNMLFLSGFKDIRDIMSDEDDCSSAMIDGRYISVSMGGTKR